MTTKNIQIWKESFTTTFICLIGCTVGSMVSAYYLSNLSWFVILPISLIVALMASISLLVLGHMWFRQMDLVSAINHSYKTSIVSVTIMILTENLIVLYLAPILLPVNIKENSSFDFNPMFFALCLGFILSLPFNHYQVVKADKLKKS